MLDFEHSFYDVIFQASYVKNLEHFVWAPILMKIKQPCEQCLGLKLASIEEQVNM